MKQTLGPSLRLMRKRTRLRLADVAQATAISVSYLSEIEVDKALPSFNTLEKLANFYGYTTTVCFKPHHPKEA